MNSTKFRAMKLKNQQIDTLHHIVPQSVVHPPECIMMPPTSRNTSRISPNSSHWQRKNALMFSRTIARENFVILAS